MKSPHLVAYEYGQGAVWAVIHAESARDIERDFPELAVVQERPPWMTDHEFEKIKDAHTYDINDRTFGLLAEIIANR
jgi:hypothetical protein